MADLQRLFRTLARALVAYWSTSTVTDSDPADLLRWASEGTDPCDVFR